MKAFAAAAGALLLFILLCTAVEGDIPYAFTDDHTLATENGWDVSIAYLEPYSLEGEVVGIRLYEDPDTPYSPADVAVAWGMLVEPGAGTLSCTMGDRQLSYSWTSTNRSIDAYYVATHVSNNHIIPRFPHIHDAIISLTPGASVSLEGYLVDVTGTKQEGTTRYTSHWGPSSLVRDDEGPGSCEIFLVTGMSVNGIEVGTAPTEEPAPALPDVAQQPTKALAGPGWMPASMGSPYGLAPAAFQGWTITSGAVAYGGFASPGWVWLVPAAAIVVAASVLIRVRRSQ